jgi:putative transposase
MDALGQGARRDLGRQPAPSAGSVDSQRLKTATPREDIGVDGTQQLTGRQRQILVDPLGVIIAVVVMSAATEDRLGLVEWLSQSCADRVKRWRNIGVDGASPAEGREAWGRGVKQTHTIDLEATTTHGGKGCHVSPWRWAVARTFAWRLNDRRQSRDEARVTANSAAMIQMSLIRLVLHRWA